MAKDGNKDDGENNVLHESAIRLFAKTNKNNLGSETSWFFLEF